MWGARHQKDLATWTMIEFEKRTITRQYYNGPLCGRREEQGKEGIRGRLIVISPSPELPTPEQAFGHVEGLTLLQSHGASVSSDYCN